MDGDVWAVAGESNSVVHFGVDSYGNVTSGPDVVSLDDKPSAPESFCGQSTCKPHPYTYSDITGYALRNLVEPKGIYRWVVSGNCLADQTRFLRVEWDADVPANTAVEVYVRSAADLDALAVAPWSAVYDTSPVDLLSGAVPLAPNPTGHLQVAFKLIPNLDISPTLRSFKILYECTP